jgi:hypothetical protein
VFSILSITVDCEGLEEKLIDYSISSPVLFFAILSFVKPRNIISLARTLYNILEMRTADLIKY